MQQFISPYANAQGVQNLLNANKRLAEFAYEFCSRFNVKLYKHVQEVVSNDRIGVITNGGLYAGQIQARRDSEGEYFVYQADHIKKARSSRRSNNNARDAKTISSLLRALVQNSEQPSDERLIEGMKGGMRYAFTQTKTSTRPRLELSSDLSIAMCEYILNINQQNLTNVMKDVDTLYSEYTTKVKKMEDANANFKRFADGSRVIGIHNPLYGDGAPFYLVTEAVYDERSEKVNITAPVVRHETLSELPELVSDVAIIRAFFDTHANDYGKHNNEFGAPRSDRYYPDIDISTGYLERNVFWLLIPKTAP